MPKLTYTDNEVKALIAIVKSEYQDGGDPVDHDVWTKYVNPFPNKRTQGGVYASLVKKGAIRVGGDYDMGTGHGTMGMVSITLIGFTVLQQIAGASTKELGICPKSPTALHERYTHPTRLRGICKHCGHDNLKEKS